MKRIILLLICISFLGLISCAGPRSTWEPARCNRSLGQLTDIEQEVIEELNLVRTKPDLYAEFIAQSGNNSKAAREAVQYLESISPVSPLRTSECLRLSAQDHVMTSGPKGTVGHAGYSDRIGRYINGMLQGSGENVSYGHNSARQIVMQWLIDERVSSRRHRLNILNEDFRSVGVAFGRHARYEHMCVAIFTNDSL